MDTNDTKPVAGPGTRRDFIKKTSTAAVAIAAVGGVTNMLRTPVYGQSQAPSPGRVAQEITVDLPFPRTNEARETPRFESFVTEVSRALRGVHHG